MKTNFPPPALIPPQSNGARLFGDRLDSWKEIASYFGREVRTVQLWEKREGLPVHRHFHRQLGSVFAYRKELEAWRNQASNQGGSPQPEIARPIQASNLASNQITVRVLPISRQDPNRYQSLCEAIVARAVSALEHSSRDLGDSGRGRLLVDLGLDGDPPCESGRPAADYLLRWALRETGGKLTVKAELVAMEAETVVWSHLYRFHSFDVDQAPGYLAEQIVPCIVLTCISSPAQLPAGHRRRERAAARVAYLKGRYFWNLRSEEGLRKAILYFEAAVQADPEFAPAYSGISDSLTLLSFYEMAPPSQVMPKARRAASRAIELDPGLAEAHASQADILFHFERDWEGADCEYRRAIQCNPDYALGYQWYANLLAAKGQHEAAHLAMMRALEIDPVSLTTLVRAGVISHLARRFDEAIRHYRNALELDPGYIWTHMYLAQALEQKGFLKEALQEFEITMKLAGGSNCVLAMKAHTHAVAGDGAYARRILERLKSAAGGKCIPSYDIAATYAALREPRQMGVWLHRACSERNMKVFTLIQDPRFDAVRSHSEFKEIAAQVGLAQFDPFAAH